MLRWSVKGWAGDPAPMERRRNELEGEQDTHKRRGAAKWERERE